MGSRILIFASNPAGGESEVDAYYWVRRTQIFEVERFFLVEICVVCRMKIDFLTESQRKAFLSGKIYDEKVGTSVALEWDS